MERAYVLDMKDAREAVVVSETETEMQLLDPWTYATVPVLRPEGLPLGAPSVQVLRHEGELIVLRP
jgi:NMD protein affecting ribosome stability and mRNA decay